MRKRRILISVSGIFAFLAFIWIYLDFVFPRIGVLYRNIKGVADPYDDYMTGIIWGVIITFILILFPYSYKRYFLALWFLKLFLVFVFDLFYEYHYPTLDAFEYYFFAKSVPHYDFIPFVGWYNIESITTMIVDVVGSYRATLVVYSLIGFIATYIFVSAYRKTQRIGRETLILFLFFPSLVFWSHIIGKDPVVFFIISLYSYGLLLLFSSSKNKEGKKEGSIKVFVSILIIIASLFSFIYFRFWITGIFGISFLISSLFVNLGLFYKIPIFLVAVATSFLGVKFVFDRFGIYDLNSFIVVLGHLSQRWAGGGSGNYVEIKDLGDLFENLPLMMFSSLFRPLPHEAKNMFQLLSGIENFIFLLLFCVSIYKTVRFGLFRDALILTFLIHVFVWTAIYSPISYQNLGNGVRFKIQVLPFALMFICRAFNLSPVPTFSLSGVYRGITSRLRVQR